MCKQSETSRNSQLLEITGEFLDEIKAAQAENSVSSWVAGRTCWYDGYVPLSCSHAAMDGPSELTIALTLEDVPSVQVDDVDASDLPPRVDWRFLDPRGYPWMDAVEFQGLSFACLPFALTAVAESLARTATGDPTLPSLSEADLLFGSGGNCWAPFDDPRPALAHLHETGILTHEDWPFEGCNPPGFDTDKVRRAGRRTRASEIAWVFVKNDPTAARWWLANCGPLLAILSPARDFLLYRAGTYVPVMRDQWMGAHAVALIGYDDVRNAWLCRNSWGRNWGEDGCCWIPYSPEDNCGILAPKMYGVNRFSMVNGVKVDTPPFYTGRK